MFNERRVFTRFTPESLSAKIVVGSDVCEHLAVENISLGGAKLSAPGKLLHGKEGMLYLPIGKLGLAQIPFENLECTEEYIRVKFEKMSYASEMKLFHLLYGVDEKLSFDYLLEKIQ